MTKKSNMENSEQWKKQRARIIRATNYPLRINSSCLEHNTNKLALDLVAEYLKKKGWVVEINEHCMLTFDNEFQSSLFQKELKMAEIDAEPFLKTVEEETLENIKKNQDRQKKKTQIKTEN